MNQINIRRFPSLNYACNEAINTLCTNLSFSGEGNRKIMVTSSHASEGKSFISMNIMRSIAKLGKTVVLVDADLRRSAIAAKYGFQFQDSTKKQGLSHLLAGMAKEDQVIYKTDLPGAYVVPVGRKVIDSLSLLASSRFEHLLNRLAEEYDYVIVDAPPVGALIDAAEIAKSCDGVLVVVSYNDVRRQELINVKEQLEQTGCPVLGAVLNRVEFEGYMTRKYYYKSYYSDYYKKSDSGKRKKSGSKPVHENKGGKVKKESSEGKA